jgi:hypothetical protein
MKQQQRLAGVTALPYCEEYAEGFHDEVIHLDARPYHRAGGPKSAVALQGVARVVGAMGTVETAILLILILKSRILSVFEGSTGFAGGLDRGRKLTPEQADFEYA